MYFVSQFPIEMAYDSRKSNLRDMFPCSSSGDNGYGSRSTKKETNTMIINHCHKPVERPKSGEISAKSIFSFYYVNILLQQCEFYLVYSYLSHST